MKTIFLFSILFCAIAMPALAELTEADLNKIRLIVNESEARVIEKVDGKIKDSENRMKSYVDTKIESVKTPVIWLIGILVAMIAIVGLPLAILTIFLGWRSVKNNSQEKINQELREEIETLKQRQIVPP